MARLGFLWPVETATNATAWFFDYNDLATSTTPLSIIWLWALVNITNDTLWPNTNILYWPAGVSWIWDTVWNAFDFSSLNIWDTIEIRLDIELTSLLNNTEVSVDLVIADGEIGSYSLPFITATDFKNAWVYNILRYNWIYIGDNLTKNNPARFKIKSDKNCSVKVHWFFCNIIRRKP